MGACDVGGSFVAADPYKGIKIVQDRYEREYGRCGGYSGGPNCVSFEYVGDKSKLTKNQIDAFVTERMEELYKRDGEIIKVGVKGYAIYTTEYLVQNRKASADALALRDRKRPATLMISRFGPYGPQYKALASGTIAEMKQYAHKYLREKGYQPGGNITIVTKDKYIVCQGKETLYKTTKRRTDEKHYVTQLNEYVYYGWAPE